LVYAVDVNILGGSVNNNKKTHSLVVAGKETGLEENADKSKYTVMSQDQNAGRIQNIKFDKNSFERVEEFKYLGRTLTNQNSIEDEIKRRLISGSVWFLSAQNILFSRFLSKNIKIKIYRNIILPVVLFGCEIWSLTMWENLD
jgi:hypothetical protein